MPFHDGHEPNEVSLDRCYVCGTAVGCTVIAQKRFVVFQDDCCDCDRRDTPDCSQTLYAKRGEDSPTLCGMCALTTS